MEGGRYANVMFAMDNLGNLRAFNLTNNAFDPVAPGTLRPVFTGGATQVDLGPGTGRCQQ